MQANGLAPELLDSGADVDVTDEGGGTPLGAAAIGGQAETVDLLLASGADVNRKDDRGWTPLHWAAHNGDPGIVGKLLEKGAETDVAGEDGVPVVRSVVRGEMLG